MPLVIRALYLAALVVAIPVITWNGTVQHINAGVADILLRLRPQATHGAVRNIVLVAIDDGTAARYGPLPLKRSTLAEGLDRLARFRPRVVAVDLLLSEPSEPDEERALAAALNRFPAAILSGALRSDPAGEAEWILPLPVFRGSHLLGHVHTEPDADGMVRSILLLKANREMRLWALGIQMVRAATGAGSPLETRDSVELGPIRIPAAETPGPWAPDRRMVINYAGPEGTFRRVPFSSLLDDTARAEDFRDKVVILGATAQGSGDRLFTPLSSGIGMSGIEIHANIARTILDHAFLIPLDVAGEMAGFVVISAACVVGVTRLRGAPLFLALAGVALAIFGASALALRMGHIWPLGGFLTVFVVAAAISLTGEYAAVSLGLRASEQKRREYAFRVQAIAHEIKTPLTAIQGSSEVISDQLVPEEQRVRMAGLIHKESRRLTEIIHTFLDVERMASGRLEIRKQPVALQSLCEEVLERARLYSARKRIQITADVPPLEVAADPDLLSFAVYNLLTNAVKYSPKQTTVSLSAAEDSGNVSIAVADQGQGIAPEEQKRIFEKFYRVKRDREGTTEGTGIGLALVKEIVTQHGGRVEVQSREGAGARFTIVLPKGAS
ncbi:MAG: CHASE2 domain-containing protein [Acidobacteria bacterium]|nr:CHASE2 domain-containing protein [Acidobacteriota bacterium]